MYKATWSSDKDCKQYISSSINWTYLSMLKNPKLGHAFRPINAVIYWN